MNELVSLCQSTYYGRMDGHALARFSSLFELGINNIRNRSERISLLFGTDPGVGVGVREKQQLIYLGRVHPCLLDQANNEWGEGEGRRPSVLRRDARWPNYYENESNGKKKKSKFYYPFQTEQSGREDCLVTSRGTCLWMASNTLLYMTYIVNEINIRSCVCVCMQWASENRPASTSFQEVTIIYVPSSIRVWWAYICSSLNLGFDLRIRHG